MVEEEHCDKLERVLSTDSILEIEAKEAIDRDAANSDTGNVSNPAIGLPSDNHGTGESRDGSPEGQRVSSFEEICQPCIPDISGEEGELLDDGPPPPAAISPPCNPDISGEEEALLDDEEDDRFLANLRSARVRGEECSSNEKVELLRAPCFNFVTLKELVKHSPPIGGFSKEDHPHGKELLLVQDFFRYTEGEGKRLLLERDRDGDGQFTLEDLEIAMANRNLPRRYAMEFLKRTRRRLFSKSFGWNGFLSVIAFDPGGETSKLLLSPTLFVASWFPP